MVFGRVEMHAIERFAPHLQQPRLRVGHGELHATVRVNASQEPHLIHADLTRTKRRIDVAQNGKHDGNLLACRRLTRAQRGLVANHHAKARAPGSTDPDTLAGRVSMSK
jgi:hypothetical protein